MGAGPASLADALALAGWGPRDLVAGVNDRLVDPARRLNPTAAYPWVRRGYMPYEPIPSIAASVLSQRLGYLVRVEQLWPDRARRWQPTINAVYALDTIATVDGFVEAIDELTALGIAGSDRVVGANGLDLLAVVEGLQGAVRKAVRRAARERVLPPQVDLIAAHVAALRRLDDRHGGGALNLRYVTSELRSVLDLARTADYAKPIGKRLLTIAADLAQLVGWLHFDASAYGPAERYLLLSLGISRCLADAGRATNAIGMLAYVSAFAGHGGAASQIADAGVRMCPEDPTLRARIVARTATAAAAAGNLAVFRRAAEEAQELLAGSDREPPEYLYYLEPEQLTAEAGQGLVVLAERLGPYRKRLLDESVALLDPVSRVGARPLYPRSALLHGTFLAKAHLLRGDPTQAVDAACAAITRLEHVQSLRGIGCLRCLRSSFAQRRSRAIATFLPQLDEALSMV
jgi:hypothetical protein